MASFYNPESFIYKLLLKCPYAEFDRKLFLMSGGLLLLAGTVAGSLFTA
jgi:hypothetical protein